MVRSSFSLGMLIRSTTSILVLFTGLLAVPSWSSAGLSKIAPSSKVFALASSTSTASTTREFEPSSPTSSKVRDITEPPPTSSNPSEGRAAEFDRFLDEGTDLFPSDGAAFLADAERMGGALFIEAIDIVGNTRTGRDVILRRLLLGVGDLVDDAKLEESRLRLLGSGFFKSVDFSLRRGSRRGFAVLVIDVVERNTLLIEDLYLGFSSVVPLFAGLGVAEHNFLGRGVTVGGGMVAGGGRRAFDGSVFVPDLSGTPLQLSASALLLEGEETIDPLADELREFGYRRIGGTLGLGLGIGPAQRISLIYRIEAIKAERLPNLDPIVLRRAPQIQFDDSLLSTMSLSYERDTRDDPFVASQGGRVALAVEVGTSVLGSTYEFSKYSAEIQQGFQPTKDHRLVLTLFGGMIQGRPPFFRQFFLNDYTYFVVGRNSLPRSAQLNFSESNDYDDVILSADANYNIPLVVEGQRLYGMYLFLGLNFAASASLEETQEDPSGRDLPRRVPISCDAGLKFDTWIGNFTLSLAYTLDLVF